MGETFLTVYTPTYKRPTWLARCKESVAANGPGIQHLIIEDTEGIGIAGVYRDVPKYHHLIEGEWVYFLNDDDAMSEGCHTVEMLREAACKRPEVDIWIVRFLINGRMYPLDWHQEPRRRRVTLGNWVVRKHVHCEVPYGQRYAGDFDFINEAYYRFTVGWLPVVFGYAQCGPHLGKPESEFVTCP